MIVESLPDMSNKLRVSKNTNSRFQTGIVTPQLLIALAAIGLIVFMMVATNLPLKDKVLSMFFIKSPSRAAETVNITAQVNSSTDDINEKGGSLDTTYGSNYPSIYIGGDTSSYAGFRFNNVNVPQGTTITSAKLLVYAIGGWIQMDFIMAAENSGNSAPFSSSSIPSSRPLTNQKITHSSNSSWAANTWIDLNNISGPVQEVVSRADWKAGNSLSVIIKGNGNINGRKFVTSFDGNSNNAPKLLITYQTNDGAITTPTPTVAQVISTPMPAQLSSTPTKAPIILTSTKTPTPTPATPTTAPLSGLNSLEYGTWTPNPTYDTCTKAQHDAYFVIGPDGKRYSTWHPALGPGGCKFGHEHGDNPATSIADPTLPAFGYGSEQAGMLEPHVGFKVAVLRAGDVVESNVDSKISNVDARQVIHMGTGGVKRYNQPLHSFEYDSIARDGSGLSVHLAGVADTGPSSQNGSTCTTPRAGAKDFSSVGCWDPYEIWNAVHFAIYAPGERNDRQGARAYYITSWAVFDPITTRDPADITKLIYSDIYYKDATPWAPAGYSYDPNRDPLSPQAFFHGCKREIYYGVEAQNTGKPTITYTDAWGVVRSNQPGPGLIKQEISAVSAHPQIIWKKSNNSCGNGIHAPN